MVAPIETTDNITDVRVDHPDWLHALRNHAKSLNPEKYAGVDPDNPKPSTGGESRDSLYQRALKNPGPRTPPGSDPDQQAAAVAIDAAAAAAGAQDALTAGTRVKESLADGSFKSSPGYADALKTALAVVESALKALSDSAASASAAMTESTNTAAAQLTVRAAEGTRAGAIFNSATAKETGLSRDALQRIAKARVAAESAAAKRLQAVSEAAAKAQSAAGLVESAVAEVAKLPEKATGVQDMSEATRARQGADAARAAALEWSRESRAAAAAATDALERLVRGNAPGALGSPSRPLTDEEEQSRRARNQLVHKLLELSDYNTSQHLSRVTGTQIDMNLVSGMATLGLTGAAAVVTGGTSQALSAAAAGTTGFGTLFNDTVYRNALVQTLVGTIRARREEYYRGQIEPNLAKSVADYEPGAALADVRRYHEMGSFYVGLTFIREEAERANRDRVDVVEQTMQARLRTGLADAQAQEAAAARKASKAGGGTVGSTAETAGSTKTN